MHCLQKLLGNFDTQNIVYECLIRADKENVEYKQYMSIRSRLQEKEQVKRSVILVSAVQINVYKTGQTWLWSSHSQQPITCASLFIYCIQKQSTILHDTVSVHK